MALTLQPFQGLLLTVSSWVRRHQERVIEYLSEENRVLKEQGRGRRLLLTDDQRRRLAAKGHAVGRKDLKEVATIVSADTVLAWYRRLIVQNRTASPEGPGRPRVTLEIRDLVVRMATENSTWGYRRIQGELKCLGLFAARSTIAEILKENGIKPAPDRPSSWKTFIKSHWGAVVRADAPVIEPSVRNPEEGYPLDVPSTSCDGRAFNGGKGVVTVALDHHRASGRERFRLVPRPPGRHFAVPGRSHVIRWRIRSPSACSLGRGFRFDLRGQCQPRAA